MKFAANAGTELASIADAWWVPKRENTRRPSVPFAVAYLFRTPFKKHAFHANGRHRSGRSCAVEGSVRHASSARCIADPPPSFRSAVTLDGSAVITKRGARLFDLTHAQLDEIRAPELTPLDQLSSSGSGSGVRARSGAPAPRSST
jgi:hypothetical protein